MLQTRFGENLPKLVCSKALAEWMYRDFRQLPKAIGEPLPAAQGGGTPKTKVASRVTEIPSQLPRGRGLRRQTVFEKTLCWKLCFLRSPCTLYSAKSYLVLLDWTSRREIQVFLYGGGLLYKSISFLDLDLSRRPASILKRNLLTYEYLMFH